LEEDEIARQNATAMTGTLLLFLPLIGALALHAPVLCFDLLRSLKHPIDGGRTFRGKRIFGDNKTWRGALVMLSGAVLATVLLSCVRAYWTLLPPPIQAVGPWQLGFLLGLGTVLGELPNSFLKRQLGIAPGERASTFPGWLLMLYDQGDFVPMVWALLAPVWIIPPVEIALAFIVLVAVHAVVNVIGYAIGARTSPV
jgi:CDP-2,3-bis-(O-geranylgeranyl)-sn-glycerol synthase